MKTVEISAQRHIENSLVIWHAQLEDVDIVIEPRPPFGVKLRPESVKNLYVFNVLGITKIDDHLKMVKGWFDMIEPGGVLYIIENDFEYINRALVAGDLPVPEFNRSFSQQTHVTKDMCIELLIKAGWKEGHQRLWNNESVKFAVPPYQFILSADKK